MFEMGAETMALPLDEKMKFYQGNDGLSFGFASWHLSSFLNAHLTKCYGRYKSAGANVTDQYGTLDTVEFLNIAQDDALAWPKPVHRTYPSPVQDHMESTVMPFVRKSIAVNMTLLNVLNDQLGLPEGTLAKKHSMEEFSGSEARCIKSLPKTEEMSEEHRAIGAHTDFGSLVCTISNLEISQRMTTEADSHFSIIGLGVYKS